MSPISLRNLKLILDISKYFVRNNKNKSKLIPKKIHQLWIPPGHLNTIPDDVLPQISAWRSFHPDFEHKIWTIDEVAASLPTSRSVRMMEAVRVARFEAMKADIVRLYLLSEFGGFWADLKVKPRRRWLDQYLNKELVLVEHFRFEQLADPAGVLTNNLIGSSAKNDFIEACIERVHENIDARLSTSVWHVAGIKVYMDIYSEWEKRNGYTPNGVVLKSDYVWHQLVELGSGSYSANRLHWSVRERGESIYLD